MDPRHAVGQPGTEPMGIEPGPRGQNVKAFTLYARTAEDAVALQKKVDAILAAYPELRLQERIDSGNVDTVSGSSLRVGLCRDVFTMSPDSTKAQPLIKIDDPLKFKIQQEFGGNSETQLDDGLLRKVEKAIGLQEHTLVYDSQNNLVLWPVGGAIHGYQGGVYGPEGDAGKGMEVDGRPLTDRPALYALANRYGLDQSEIAAGIISHEPPKEITLEF